MTQEAINILKVYISEEEIKDLVVTEFKNLVREEIKNISPSKRIADYERVISNAVFYFLESEIDALMGADAKSLIEQKIKDLLNKSDLQFSIFRTKSPWDEKGGVGTEFIKEAVTENKHLIQNKVKAEIEAINFSDLKEDIKTYILEVIDEKLKA